MKPVRARVYPTPPVLASLSPSSMPSPFPCPACGSPNELGSEACNVCGFLFGGEAGVDKCARCGSGLGEGFQFCQVCGLEVGSRMRRPPTQRLRVVNTEARRRRAKRDEPEAAAGSSAPSTQVGAAVGSSPARANLGTLSQSPLRLVLVNRDGSDGQSFFLPDSQITIGRHEGDLRFESDEFLSPIHARLELRDSGLWVVDLGSVNGVFLRLFGSASVYPGDAFLLGHQLLRLENAPITPESDMVRQGVRIFGTPLEPAWGRLTLVAAGGAAAETYFLRSAQVTFGRENGDILFPGDAFISRQHAQLAMGVSDGHVTVTLADLRSANGTYLRIRGQAALKVGDMFRVGDQIFRVRMD